ncbi:MAG: hypothetical protein WEB57_00060 [Pseudohongiellaceae bacterium]
MRYCYPVFLTADDEGNLVASARDVPEALTEGCSESEALAAMADALGAALAGYSHEGVSLPLPSVPQAGERMVAVTPLVAAKLALRSAMQAQGMTNVALAERLRISEGAVRRLVNPDHQSRLDGVAAALQCLGRQLVLEDRDTAAGTQKM